MIAKSTKVVTTNEKLIADLKVLVSRQSFYKNKYPFNLLYNNSDGRVSGDCSNTYKALFNGYNVGNLTVGYFQRDLSNTGDCTEAELLSQCTDISQNFSQLIDGRFEILYMKGHIGGFIGTTSVSGHTYNVIECTASWGGGIMYSWVDADGTRRKCKGGAANGKWTHHGLPSSWVSYNGTPAKKTNEAIVKEVIEGKWGNGVERKSRLTAAGYDYNAIQKIVNELCKKPTQTSGNIVEYVVKKGDTFNGIAKKYKIPVGELKELNPQIRNYNLIYPGQKIRLK